MAVSRAEIASFPEIGASAFYAQFRGIWRQGEHVALLGPTGSGKTYTARELCAIRDYVIVLAVKREDDTLDLFSKSEPRYRRTKKWPVDYNVNRAVLSLQPDSLADTSQAMRVYTVLNDVFKAGGWCVLIDDTGYVAGYLKLRRQVTQLLNTGRSSGISVVTAATQATSVAANIPSETLRQVRHILMWRFEDSRDIEACAGITGLDKHAIGAAMRALRVYSDSSTDYLYYRRGYGLTLVRQERVF